MATCSSEKSVRKGLQGPSHLSLAWKNRSHWNSVMKNRMSFNVTGGDFPVEKRVRDRRNQQRLHIFYHVLAAQRRSNTSFFLAWRLVDILDEHYSFSVFFSKLCCALRGLRDLSERDRRWKQTFVAVRAFWSPKRSKPQVMMHKGIFRPHLALNTCCTVLSSHGDDSWI